KDEFEAFRYMRESAKEGFANAQYDIGVAYLNGDTVQKNPAEAGKWLQKAAAQQHQGAIAKLNELNHQGDQAADGMVASALDKSEEVPNPRNMAFDQKHRVTDVASPYNNDPVV